ncbi:ATP-binding protein [Ligilactobacillus cholophilus]|uniref:ATP-binding protein n=1 Tax=Ligilactobacillus cholophilus TaxID=3050131 RepID=UPI0025B21AFB|nr:ATP-binding protein [Ligilactobacillus cholophilus]
MELEIPFKLFKDNLLLTKTGDVWAYYKIKPESIAINDLEHKEQNKKTMAFVYGTLSKYQELHLMMLPKDMNLADRFNHLAKDFSPSADDVAHYYANETVKQLEYELGTITDEEFLVGVKLKTFQTSDNMKGVVKDSYDYLVRKLLTAVGYDMEVDASYFKQFSEDLNELDSVMRTINGSPVSENELAYLLHYNFLRELPHNVLATGKEHDLYKITDTILDPTEKGYLKLENENGSSYVAFIPVGALPDNISFTHLYEVAQSLKFPVELQIKAQYEEVEGLNGLNSQLSRLRRRFKSSSQEAYQTGERDSQRNVTNQLLVDELQNDIEDGKAILRWLACFVITGHDKDEIKERSDRLINRLGLREIDAYRPNADQLSLFYQLLQGQSIQGAKNWIQVTNNEGFAENLFAVSNRLGNNVGWYIGRVDDMAESQSLEQSIYSSRKIVLFNPTIANKGIKGAKTDSPHIAVTGETGKGKSFLVKLLFIYMSFMKTRLLYIDPKKEIRHWFNQVIENQEMQEKYPLFVNHLKSFHYVTLDATDKKNWGVLDPIVFLKGSDAKDTAEAMIEQIYSTKDKDTAKTAILKAIKTVINQRELGEKVGMLNVIEILQKSDDPEIRGAGNLLYEMVTDSVLQLGFSDGTNDAVSLQERINILEVSGLELPKEGDNPDNYSDLEKKSVALMIPLGKFCEKFGSDDTNTYTAEVFDEAWIFNVAKDGKKILKSMKRVGRSQNNMLLYATQSVADITDQEDHGQFGVLFAFDEPSEREQILQHVQLPVNEQNLNWLANMIKGQCLFRDIYGRVGKIAVHSLFDEMTSSFKTINKSASSASEELYD